MPHGLRLCWAGAVASPRRLLPRTWARVSCWGRGADPQACPALLHKEHLGLGCSGPTSGWGTWLCFTPRGSSGCRTQKGPMPSLCALDGSPRARIAGAQLCQKTNADAAPNLIFFFIYTLSGSKKHFRQCMPIPGLGAWTVAPIHCVIMGMSLTSRNLSFPICEMGTPSNHVALRIK